MQRLVGAAVIALFAPLVAFAAPRTFADLANQLVVLIDSAVFVIIAAALVWYFWGMAKSIQGAKNKGGEMLRTYAGYGVLIIFVMVSLWGIIQILQNSLFGGGSGGGTTGGGGGGQQYQSGFFPPNFGG